MTRTSAVVTVAVALALTLAACSTAGDGAGASPSTGATTSEPASEPTSEPASEPTASGTSDASPDPTTEPSEPSEPVETVTVDQVVTTGLAQPWGLAPLPEGGLVVTLRDEARLVVVGPDGSQTDVTGPGADTLADETVPGGEGGLLGVAVAPEPAGDGGTALVVYRTGQSDNAVLTGRLDGTELGELTTVVDGIPRARTHNGGQVGFGPDGHLYVSTGDAGDPSLAQDPDSLGGKILRVTLEGEPAPDNPVADSPVLSLGHRNVQGLGWDAGGVLYASEFGQNDLDELNRIEPGGNYGWPDVEGDGGTDDGFVDPVATWATDVASPSGLAVTPSGVWLAGLRGQRLWLVPFDGDDRATGEPRAYLEGELGRVRAVVAGGERGLWVLTNNTDGRGAPGPDDDRLLRLTY
ncbi:glucose sorbosone dehydrogenase [Serinibacter arcticus]|uniref:Glucose sorbosone dehydrogenase n=1 Tax=Serinibacter arcticus TaxID=1655435 RepID=A0A2U1ZYG8_9MICO|nr:PQQ-dependent sugar dehydrogenase [Serinibacter arcticus]PWD51962.1 glucose sorbosone dehydrogenase [Serinibacter arcticus]